LHLVWFCVVRVFRRHGLREADYRPKYGQMFQLVFLDAIERHPCQFDLQVLQRHVPMSVWFGGAGMWSSGCRSSCRIPHQTVGASRRRLLLHSRYLPPSIAIRYELRYEFALKLTETASLF